MTRAFLGLGVAVALVWATASCSDDDKKKTTTNKLCTENSDCSEPFSECEHVTTNATVGTCTKSCTSKADCPEDHSCQQGADIGLEPSCIATCSETRGCPEGHNCLTNSEGLSICIPAAWSGS